MRLHLRMRKMFLGGGIGSAAVTSGIVITGLIYLLQVSGGHLDLYTSATPIMKVIIAIMASTLHAFPLNFQNDSER